MHISPTKVLFPAWLSALLALLLSLVVILPMSTYADSALEAGNKKIVLDFYEKALNQKDFAAASEYLGKDYRQHNPNVADGPEGFKAFVDFLRDKYPQSHCEILRAFAEGDYVILHVHAVREPENRGRAIVDIFKLKDGKIIEHWDVNQPVPDTAANNNTMF